MPEFSLLFIAGLFSGIVNALAGGGTFISFPVLLAVGVPPVSANATNTLAVFPGYVSGVIALRKQLLSQRDQLLKYIVISLLGGLLGAWLLMQTDDQQFSSIIPWLLLLATLLFMFGERINNGCKKLTSAHPFFGSAAQGALALTLLLVCVYGGFFNAGLGVILLSYLVLAGYSDLNTMNAIKLLVSSSLSLVAVVVFIVAESIAWREGLIVMLGAILGGYLAGHYSQRVPGNIVRAVVMVISVALTLYFFYDTYFRP